MQKILLIRFLMLPGLLVWLISACHPTKSLSKLTVKVNTAKDESVDFSRLKTFNWYQDSPEQAASVSAPYNTRLAALIRQSVEDELMKRGYSKSAANPDMLVAFDVSVPRSEEPPGQTYNPGFGYSYSHMLGYRYAYGHQRIGNYRPVGQYQPNSLFIDIIDPQTNELIWRGYTENVIESYTYKQQTVQNLVDDILDKLAHTK